MIDKLSAIAEALIEASTYCNKLYHTTLGTKTTVEAAQIVTEFNEGDDFSLDVFIEAYACAGICLRYEAISTLKDVDDYDINDVSLGGLIEIHEDPMAQEGFSI